jgi:hypothetical protein
MPCVSGRGHSVSARERPSARCGVSESLRGLGWHLAAAREEFSHLGCLAALRFLDQSRREAMKRDRGPASLARLLCNASPKRSQSDEKEG